MFGLVSSTAVSNERLAVFTHVLSVARLRVPVEFSPAEIFRLLRFLKRPFNVSL